MTSQLPKPPVGLAARGRRLWRDVHERYDLAASDTILLTEACRTLDLADRLAVQLARESLTVAGSRGQAVLNPIAAELRQQRDLLGRMLSRLALPDDESNIESIAARLGRRGANARWYRKGA